MNTCLRYLALVFVSVFAFCVSANAQALGEAPTDDISPLDLLGHRSVFHENLDFGERLNLDTGTLSFAVTDMSIPGNSTLPVSFGRRYGGMSRNVRSRDESLEVQGWLMDVPMITGVAVGGSAYNQPDDVAYLGTQRLLGWVGVHMFIPGETQKTLRWTRNPNLDHTQGYYYNTDDNWVVTRTVSGSDVSFVATSPTGVKYFFDHYIDDPDLSGRGVVAATRAEDVHGNWVNYNYSGLQPVSITSSDGRQIDFSYAPPPTGATWGELTSVSANGKTWIYSQGAAGLEVTLPDGRTWEYSNLDISQQTAAEECYLPGALGQLTVKHPAGHTATYDIDTIANGRIVTEALISQDNGTYSGSHLPQTCGWEPIATVGSYYAPANWIKLSYSSRAVASKTISYAQGVTENWSYSYEEDNGAFRSTFGLPLTKARTVTRPDGTKEIVRIYRVADYREGLTKETETRDASDSVMEVISSTYRKGAYNLTAQTPGRGSWAVYNNEQTYDKILDVRTVTRGPDTYTTQYFYNENPQLSSYTFGEPKEYRESSSTHTRERIFEYTYEHKLSKWVIGLLKTKKQNGKLIDSVTYNANGQIDQYDRFGSIFATFGYFTSGTAAGEVNWHENALDERTTLSNYKRGIPQTIVRRDSVTVSQTVDDDGRVTSQTNGRQYTTSFEYDLNGWPTKIIPSKADGTAADTIINYTHVPLVSVPETLVQTITHGDLQTTRTFDQLGRLILEKREDVTDSNVTSFVSRSFDYKNQLTYESLPSTTQALADATGIETDYDALGRVTEIRQIMAPFATTKSSYLSGNRIRLEDPRGNASITSFENYGGPQDDPVADEALPISVVLPLGATTEIDYDIYGNPTHQRQMSGSTVLAETVTSYDVRLRPTTVTDPAGDITRTFYDALDRPIVEKDGENRATRTVYDNMSRVDKLIRAWAGADDGTGELNCQTMRNNYDPALGYLQQCYQDFEYDANSNIDWIEDARGNRTNYSYDAVDRQKLATFPDGSYTQVQAYDPFGNPLTTRTRAGQIHTATYDALSRMVAMNTPDRDSAYAYDAADRRTCAAVFSPGSLSPGSASDCLSTSAGRQHQTLYAFDGAGRMTSETALAAGVPSLTTGYQYDLNDSRTRITWPDNYFAQYEYDANNRLDYVRENGSTVLAHYDYDAQSRLNAITYGGDNYAAGSGVSQSVFNWEVDSDLSELTHRFLASPDVSFTYGYDKSAKLTSEFSNLAGWLYEPSGPRTDTYGVANSLNQYPDVKGAAVLYDLNGSRTSYAGLDTPHDSENRLEGIGTSITYAYDADGRRTLKADGVTTTQFVHAGDMEIGEYVGGVLQHRYIPGHSVDQRVAWLDVGVSTAHYYHANRLGSVQAVVDTAGTVTDQYVYTPFGIEEPLVTTGSPFRYTGQRYDPESDLYYYRARYYDAAMGRFLETDPIGYADQMNMYAYVHNDPVNATDPTGMQTSRRDQNKRRMEYLRQRDGARRDFRRNFNDMKDDNTIGNDKFFHCKANCEATQRGPTGEKEAERLSDLREVYGQIKGDPAEDSRADQEANKAGRDGANENPNNSCSSTCSEYIVSGMNEKYVDGEPVPGSESTPPPEPEIREEELR